MSGAENPEIMKERHQGAAKIKGNYLRIIKESFVIKFSIKNLNFI
jgi:hypothetical protein